MKANSLPSHGFFIELKDNNWLQKQRFAGKVHSEVMDFLVSITKSNNKVSTLEMSKLAEEIIIKNNCTPTFKNYKGFPEAVCISINNELIHGIPKDNIFPQDENLITFDFGVTFENAIVDAATTVIWNKTENRQKINLINAGRAVLNSAINNIKIKENLGTIGFNINKTAQTLGYSVVQEYGGHGIWGNNYPHAKPFVSNKDSKDNGIRIQNGFCFAIEPLLVIGNPATFAGNDGWTVKTEGLSVHEEHSIFIWEDQVEVLTRRHNENII